MSSARDTALQDCVDSLSEPGRTLVIEVYLNGRYLGEVAEEQGLSDPAAQVTISRALFTLRDCMKGKGF